MSDKQSAFFRDILDNLPQCIFWKNVDSKFLGCNAEFASRVGLEDPENIAGLSDFDLPWGLEESSKFRNDDQEIIKSRVPRLFYEEVQTQQDGNKRVMLVSKVPVFSEQNNAGIVCIYHDITEQKILERSLAEAVEAAEMASRAKSDFIANMSHDFRVPMSGFLGMLEALVHSANVFKKELFISTHSLDELRRVANTFISQTVEYASIAADSGQELTRLFDDILESTEIESGETNETLQQFSVRQMMQKKVALLALVAEKKGVTLQYNLSQSVPETMAGYPNLLGRVLLNLISNALKFTHEGFVRVDVTTEGSTNDSAHVDEKKLIITVTDSGIGIDGNDFEKIFENFSRLSPSYDGVYEGHGMGLYAVKGYLGAMNGDIFVESELGVGSCFKVVVPLSKFQAEENPCQRGYDSHSSQGDKGECDRVSRDESVENVAHTSADAHDEGGPLADMQEPNPIHVLLVEDNPAASLAIQLLLKQLNCVVHSEAAGLGAVEVASKNCFDFILLDIGLPDITGIEVATRIRSLENDQLSSVPIVALTGHAGGDQRSECLKAGICEVLTKPADPVVIKAALRKWVW